jgi:hypothetical protein
MTVLASTAPLHVCHPQVLDEPLYGSFLSITGLARPYRDLVLQAQVGVAAAAPAAADGLGGQQADSSSSSYSFLFITGLARPYRGLVPQATGTSRSNS